MLKRKIDIYLASKFKFKEIDIDLMSKGETDANLKSEYEIDNINLKSTCKIDI